MRVVGESMCTNNCICDEWVYVNESVTWKCTAVKSGEKGGRPATHSTQDQQRTRDSTQAPARQALSQNSHSPFTEVGCQRSKGAAAPQFKKGQGEMQGIDPPRPSHTATSHHAGTDLIQYQNESRHHLISGRGHRSRQRRFPCGHMLTDFTLAVKN
ncbi:uncharacterized protein FYW61_010730 [Anableps anableps]